MNESVTTADTPPVGPHSEADTPGPRPETCLRCPHCHNPIQLADGHSDDVLCPGCGSSFKVREAWQTTTTGAMRQLGKFQILERVGAGPFGAVWRARDTELDRVVVLKIPHSGALADEAELARFQREARAAAQLRHPGIVTVHEVQTLDGLPTIVSDFIDGVPLKDFLGSRRLTFPEAAALVAEVAEALDYAHDMGVVHRDIKPANILLHFARPGDAGKPLVTDFGLALRGVMVPSARWPGKSHVRERVSGHDRPVSPAVLSAGRDGDIGQVMLTGRVSETGRSA
jgi:serine/threonine protein kinase